MLRSPLHPSAQSPRLVASALGVVMTAFSAAQLVHAAEGTNDVALDTAVSLGATQITGEGQDQTAYQVEKASSPKYTAPLVDTPRSVTVVAQQVLKDTGATSLQDALRTVPGITFGAGEGGNPQGDRPFIRGFDAQGDTYLDGVRDTGSQTREIFDVDSIEVSKGPNSAFGGRGSAGGSLNIVSKAPKDADFTDGGFTFGSDQTRRYTLDVNRKFLDTAAFRLNLMSHEQNVAGRDAVNYDRWGVAPSVTFGLGTPTRVNVNYYHLESNDLPDSGIPYGYSSASATAAHVHDKPTDGGNSSNFYGLKDRDFRKTRTDISTFSIEHDINDEMTLKNTLRHGSTRQDYIVTQPDDSQHNVNQYGTVWRRANTRVSSTETSTNQTDLFGEFRALGFKNKYSTGLEVTREESTVTGYTVTPNSNPAGGGCRPGVVASGTCTSLSDPNDNDDFSGSIARNYAGTNTVGNTRALYAFDTIELDPKWLLNFGLRYDTFDTTAKNTTTGRTSNESNFWNWQAGLVWKPIENGSVYVSYATSATPPGSSLNEGSDGNPLTAGNSTLQSDLQPETTKNYELGTKWDLFHDRLSLTAAVFRTEKENTRVLVQSNTYQNAGKSRVDGLELSATGKITEKWQVFAGYSYLNSELVDPGLTGRNGVVTANALSSAGNEMPNTPKNSFSLWTTYEVIPKLTIGGGAFYVDDVYGDPANTVYVPSYTRYDAMASYKLTKNVDLQLNVQNLTDKTYYDKAYAAHFANQAAGRTALMGVSVHF
ncbi:TonB-dependent siderophore receptor [Pseudomonas sp. CCI3.2]|uniref:TonB-dependent receptor n=1 Tax=unclassified Pseudomonas TaxID=196821 RepID=UPI002AC9CC58|nr:MULTISPECIES: TonB-dependent siderophore receptor [unclassified Pseudomonas]MEB0078214.1 TonB-dependent siderophore receptor [Pseudomonas sp. MH10out]MEB0093099.1 TonB-dependent siderophore receptor [Pseudomonas sp. CCI4.2]MEB0100024.1 TonB-dependent siderophore receptor [Pseudomonas sp. CCI3.2]MEB0129886.1 TonB-dependent siderophore receptor [Pseudomonas sp. CCI2.4]MEB0157749.1 TonB-dependent siderophore receptor [Pseudomonas sp. AH2 (2023)]